MIQVIAISQGTALVVIIWNIPPFRKIFLIGILFQRAKLPLASKPIDAWVIRNPLSGTMTRSRDTMQTGHVVISVTFPAEGQTGQGASHFQLQPMPKTTMKL